MKLRALAAVPLVAAAMLGTTAAAWPSATAAKPQAPPALTATALSARYAATRSAVTRAEATATRDGDRQRAQALAGLRSRQVLFFNPNGAGVAAMVIGNLATAHRVAIVVPGSDTDLTTFFSRGPESPGGAAEALATEARKLEPKSPGEKLAIIAWLGYPTPAMLSPSVMTSGDAGQGAQALKPLVTALARHGAQVALLCHSYGSVVCGLAAPDLPVTDIAVFGSPGMDANSVAGLHTSARVWAGREAGDSIRYVPHIHLFGLGFGADPMSPGFGARIFATGDGGHSGYLDPGSASLRNLTYIALGDPAAVTR
ncbi:MAG TPA: alpha/beta hydrolase [Streptosporangiaceae bacterium]|nr:alpha/beta hydrolase [Streptosporangiaceae bacterium]